MQQVTTMHPLITSHRAAIDALCRQYGVRRLDVFGSALRSDFDAASSDVDFVVDFEPGVPGARLDRYFGFKGALESLLNRSVDLVELPAMRSPRLRRIVERSRVPLYATPA